MSLRKVAQNMYPFVGDGTDNFGFEWAGNWHRIRWYQILTTTTELPDPVAIEYARPRHPDGREDLPTVRESTSDRGKQTYKSNHSRHHNNLHKRTASRKQQWRRDAWTAQ